MDRFLTAITLICGIPILISIVFMWILLAHAPIGEETADGFRKIRCWTSKQYW